MTKFTTGRIVACSILGIFVVLSAALVQHSYTSIPACSYEEAVYTDMLWAAVCKKPINDEEFRDEYLLAAKHFEECDHPKKADAIRDVLNAPAGLERDIATEILNGRYCSVTDEVTNMRWHRIVDTVASIALLFFVSSMFCLGIFGFSPAP